MTLAGIFAGSLFFLVRDEGLTAVWETLLAFQVVRSVLFAYRCVGVELSLSLRAWRVDLIDPFCHSQ